MSDELRFKCAIATHGWPSLVTCVWQASLGASLYLRHPYLRKDSLFRGECPGIKLEGKMVLEFKYST